MINGDISNETSPRIIVMVDVVANSEIEEEKKMFKTVYKRKISSLNHLNLSHLWNITNKYGLSVELAAMENEHWEQPALDKIMDRLDRRGGNPFNYAEVYPDVFEFIAEIPYRNNLKGVIDLRERVMMYGSYGIELNNL